MHALYARMLRTQKRTSNLACLAQVYGRIQ